MNINEYIQEIIKGLVLLGAVIYDTMSLMKNEKVKKMVSESFNSEKISVLYTRHYGGCAFGNQLFPVYVCI